MCLPVGLFAFPLSTVFNRGLLIQPTTDYVARKVDMALLRYDILFDCWTRRGNWAARSPLVSLREYWSDPERILKIRGELGGG